MQRSVHDARVAEGTTGLRHRGDQTSRLEVGRELVRYVAQHVRAQCTRGRLELLGSDTMQASIQWVVGKARHQGMCMQIAWGGGKRAGGRCGGEAAGAPAAARELRGGGREGYIHKHVSMSLWLVLSM